MLKRDISYQAHGLLTDPSPLARLAFDNFTFAILKRHQSVDHGGSECRKYTRDRATPEPLCFVNLDFLRFSVRDTNLRFARR